jgi:type I restriction enzyme S subunit
MRWLPRIPEHWDEQRAKVFFREANECSSSGDEELMSVSHLTGVTPRSQKNVTMFKAASYVGHKICRPADIVVNTLWAWMGALGAARETGLVSPAYGVYRPYNSDAFNPMYLDYLLRTRAYVAEYTTRSTGIRSSRLRLYPDQFLDIRIVRPPRIEQDQIVAYLRSRDASIGRLLSAKRALIALLTEQKQLIVEGSLRGSSSGERPRRSSVIGWLGQIPEGWNEYKFKHVAIFNPSRSENAQRRLDNEQVSFVPMECITTDGKLVGKQTRRISEVWSGYTYFQRNDVVMAKITPCFENGKGGLLDGLPTDIGFGTTEFIVLRPVHSKVRPAYLATLLSLRTFRIFGADAMTGAAGQQRVPLEFVKNFGIPVPPLDEQDKILSSLQTATMEQDAAIDRIKLEMGFLREYRERIVADVVTGRVDVRGWKPDPGDQDQEDSLLVLEDGEDTALEGEDLDGAN